MKLKNCLGFLFYLHSLSLSPPGLSLSHSPSFSGSQLTVSLAIAFFPSVLRNFRTFFLPVLATPLRQPPQTHFKRFVGCGKRKEESRREREGEGGLTGPLFMLSDCLSWS